MQRTIIHNSWELKKIFISAHTSDPAFVTISAVFLPVSIVATADRNTEDLLSGF